MSEGRDTYIDFARGLMILSVIHIHTIYWSLSAYTPDIVRHLAYLVDIPIFFFISGYLFRNTTFVISIRSALRQFVRLYFHYVVISLLVGGCILLWLRWDTGQAPTGAWESLRTIFHVKLKGALWSHLKMYDGNLWYIRTYFSLVMLAPLLIGLPLFHKMKGCVIAFVFVAYALMLYAYKGHIFIWENWNQILFYALFFVLGAIYRAGEKQFGRRAAVCALGLNVLLAGLIFHLDGNTLRLTPCKFPPNVQYLVYTLLLVHVFILAKPYWGRASTPAVSRAVTPVVWAGKHSYVLYLVQGAVCSLPVHFVHRLESDNAWTLYAMVYSFNVLLTFFASWLYVAGSDVISRLTRAIRARCTAATSRPG